MCNDDSPLGVYNMTGRYAIPQGADWQVGILYREQNVAVDFSSGYTARMQVRKDYGKEVILELLSEDGTIVLTSGASDTPNVTLNFGSAITSAMTVYDGIYDLEVVSTAGSVNKFLEGTFQLRREVTI
jgi:hypothetical protein